MSGLYDLAEIMTTTGRGGSESARRRPEHLEAMHVVHEDVAKDHRRSVRPRQGYSGRSLLSSHDHEAALRENEGQELEQARVVVDDEKRLAGPLHGRGALCAHDDRVRSVKPAMTRASSSGSTGLPTWVWKPASRARRRSSAFT